MKSNIYEGGIRYRPEESVALSFTAFYNDVKDLIDRDTNRDPYLNVDEAVFKGFEATLAWDIHPKAGLDLSYTRLEARDLTSEDRSYIQYRPGHKFDFRSVFLLPEGFKVNFSGSVVSSQVFYEEDGEHTLDGYGLFDMGITKTVRKHWELYFTAHNLFDALYYESSGYPMEGRMTRAGMRYNR
jgi:outer membrane receptor protein involved in Fe transport